MENGAVGFCTIETLGRAARALVMNPEPPTETE
jgi:hypothetical protein